MSGSESGNRSESELFEIHVDETIDNDREPEENQVSSSCGAQEKNRKRARACECDEKEADVPRKMAATATGEQLSMMQFMKTNQKVGMEVKDKRTVKNQDYTKYKHVCLICAKNENLKNKSIISRGGIHIERHFKRNHPSIPLSSVKEQVVTLDHISVPKGIRDLVSKQKESKKQANEIVNSTMVILNQDDPAPGCAGTSAQTNEPNGISTGKSILPTVFQAALATAAFSEIKALFLDDEEGITLKETETETLYKEKESEVKVSSFVQSGIEGYVDIPKPNMEEKFVSMIERLTIKVDNLSKSHKFSTNVTAPLPSSQFKLHTICDKTMLFYSQ